MGRKRKELPVVENVEITGVAAEGKSIARVDDMVVFIPYGAPGDVVNIKLDKKKRSYAEAHIVDMVKPSPDRVTPACEHFGVCGGCKWQHIPYESQLRYKRKGGDSGSKPHARVKRNFLLPQQVGIHVLMQMLDHV